MNQIIIIERCKTLRALGREALRGKWKLAALTTAIYLIVMQVPTSLLVVLFKGVSFGILTPADLYTLLVGGPFTLGYSVFMLSIFRNMSADASQVFSGFEFYGKATGLFCMMAIFITLWSFLLIIPGIIAALRYSQAFFILADNPELGIFECINRSKLMMYGNKGKLFLLLLSNIGWYILASVPVIIYSNLMTKDIASQMASAEFSDFQNLYNYMMEYYMESYYMTISYHFIVLLLSAGMIWVLAYVFSTLAGFYEILAGNLKPGYIRAEAEIV